ncbi:hypothetical protein QRX50_35170 [Amycolatopsis carbonis]|uniref:Uncharacterized protein n=1 Tax=Amycolatopsis carbonis TaxID=715471 RepID=A0A9Y2IE30_9PSEU|nr:hypothetical protein [Amycolatopsis sp. 2-15]WIX76663.1 hypothetical protein QRX50_35170 [Amycolatopsis sp. 2-15]
MVLDSGGEGWCVVALVEQQAYRSGQRSAELGWEPEPAVVAPVEVAG